MGHPRVIAYQRPRWRAPSTLAAPGPFAPGTFCWEWGPGVRRLGSSVLTRSPAVWKGRHRPREKLRLREKRDTSDERAEAIAVSGERSEPAVLCDASCCC